MTVAWHKAACIGQGAVFERDEMAAKDICHACPISAECLAHALERNETGIWGGLNDTERGNTRHGRHLQMLVPPRVMYDRRRYARGDRDRAARAANAAYIRAHEAHRQQATA